MENENSHMVIQETNTLFKYLYLYRYCLYIVCRHLLMFIFTSVMAFKASSAFINKETPVYRVCSAKASVTILVSAMTDYQFTHTVDKTNHHVQIHTYQQFY